MDCRAPQTPADQRPGVRANRLPLVNSTTSAAPQGAPTKNLKMMPSFSMATAQKMRVPQPVTTIGATGKMILRVLTIMRFVRLLRLRPRAKLWSQRAETQTSAMKSANIVFPTTMPPLSVSSMEIESGPLKKEQPKRHQSRQEINCPEAFRKGLWTRK